MKKIDGKTTFYGHEIESSKLSIKIMRDFEIWQENHRESACSYRKPYELYY